MLTITICGGGSLGHVCAGVLASHTDVRVNVLTQQPERWADTITITDLNGKRYEGQLGVVSSDPAEALRGAVIVFLCLPGYAIESTLQRIRNHIGNACVGSIVCSTGFFFAAHRVLGPDAPLFGFQRTPFIARTTAYGRAANLLGYKSSVAIATENIDDTETFRTLVERLWLTPTRLLRSHYEVSITNSNPILHTARLYTLWHDWDGSPTDRCLLFYREWTVAASELLIAMDREFMALVSVLPVTPGAIPPLLEYYESHDAESLTRKISSIPAFADILAPMRQLPEGGWVPDFHSRYFTEDFPYGLQIIVRLAHEHAVPVPTLQRVLDWGLSVANPS